MTTKTLYNMVLFLRQSASWTPTNNKTKPSLPLTLQMVMDLQGKGTFTNVSVKATIIGRESEVRTKWKGSTFTVISLDIHALRKSHFRVDLEINGSVRTTIENHLLEYGNEVILQEVSYRSGKDQNGIIYPTAKLYYGSRSTISLGLQK